MLRLVSIIIPAYNARHYVCDAIDSALAQSHRQIEVIVVDDGSTDGTGELLQQKYDDQITYIYKKNGGPASARNLGIRMSRGEFIAFLDADDLWLPGKLERQLGVFAENTLLVGSGRNSNNDHFIERIGFTDLVFNNRFANSGVVIRRTALDQVGLLDERPELIAVEDWDLWIRLAQAGETLLLHGDLVVCRQTENNLSAPAQAGQMLAHEKVVLRKHLTGKPFMHALGLSFRYLAAAWAFRECRARSKALTCILLAFCLFPPNLFDRRNLAMFIRIIIQKGA